MPYSVQVNSPYKNVELPNGHLYDGPTVVTLADLEYTSINAAAFNNGILTDLGPVVPPQGATGPQGVQGPQGPQGIQGPQGTTGSGTGGSSFYRFVQGVPSTVWTIPHNLGYKPNVQSFDSRPEQVQGDILHVDGNNLTITFAFAISGEAELS